MHALGMLVVRIPFSVLQSLVTVTFKMPGVCTVLKSAHHAE